MKKQLCLLITFVLLFVSTTLAQHYEWAERIGGAADQYANDMVVDGQGNAYMVGSLQGTNIDFDPGAGTALLSSAGMIDIFIAKYDSSGNYVWAKQIGGANDDIAARMDIDNSGNIHISGWFLSTSVDFDPGTGLAMLGSAGLADIFFAKYDGDGNYIWARRIGTSSGDGCHDIDIDGSDNVYITGYFFGTNTDFDPGPGTAYLSSLGNSGDIFLAKYDASGNYLWATSVGGSNYDVGNGIMSDGAGNVYIAGPFSGANVDFDPGPGTAYLSTAGGYDIFIAKYDSSRNYLWAERIGGSGDDIGGDVVLDGLNNLLVPCYFHGTNVDFDPGPGTASLSSAGGYDIALAKYDASGIYQWGYRFGGPSDDYAGRVLLDQEANVYVTGMFSGTNTDFDPGPDTAYLNSVGNQSPFFAKYNSLGDYTWAASIQGIGNGTGIAISSSKAIYVSGGFGGTNVDFDPGSASSRLSSAGGTDIFIAKYLTLSGLYLGQTPPDTIPQVFASGIVSTSSHEYSVTCDPQSEEFYCTRVINNRSTILRSRRIHDEWSPLQVAPFSGTTTDQEAYITPDGERLYFGSERSFPGSQNPTPYHIWYMDKTDDGWSTPAYLGEPFKSAPVMYPTVSLDGNMYIGERYDDISDIRNGIYVATNVNGEYQTLEKLGTEINKGYGEAHPFIAPDESYLVFDATDRPGGYGQGDLYISYRKSDGSWTESVNLGNSLNTSSHEGIPYVTPDGEYLMFLRLSAGSDGDIYWVDASFIEDLRPVVIDTTQKIVFESWRTGTSEIYTMNYDGSQVKRLTINTAEDRWPAFSSDGNKIAFCSNRDGNYELYVMDGDGGNQTRITVTPDIDEATSDWSPDNTKISYLVIPEGDWLLSEIHVMNADGTGDMAITGNASGDSRPIWSPDGTKILFFSKRDGHYEVYVMNSDGSNPQRLTYSSTNAAFAQWSPDGMKIAYNDVDIPTMTGQIHVMNADGSGDRVLTNAAGINENPCWSADGHFIVFQSNRDGNYEVYIMNADGSNQLNLTSLSAWDSWPDWGVIQQQPVEIVEKSLLAGTLGCPYADAMEIVPGTGVGPFQWNVTNGSLPEELLLGEASGIISGTPAETGVFSFTVQVTDARQTQDAHPFVLTVDPHADEKADVNADCTINVLDVLTVVNIILDLKIPDQGEIWRADCSGTTCEGDGTINVLDALMIVNIILGTAQCP